MPILYSITGSLPASWEDFLSRDANYPSITIMTKDESDADAAKSGVQPSEVTAAALANAPTDSKWLDIVVDVSTQNGSVLNLSDLNFPTGLAYYQNDDGDNYLFVSDTGNNQVKRIELADPPENDPEPVQPPAA